MRVLLDTHALLWWVDDDRRLPRRARNAIRSKECAVNLASAWEISIKASLGKIRLTLPAHRFFAEQAANGFSVLPIRLEHIGATEALSFHRGDPFDRLLIAQAKTEGLTIVSANRTFDVSANRTFDVSANRTFDVSANRTFDSYGIRRIW